MPTPKTLHGSTVNVPIKDETDWGSEVSGYEATLIDSVDGATLLTSTGVTLVKFEVTTGTLAASATLTATHPIHRIAGASGAVTLDVTTAIADGQVDGQLLILKGTNDTNTVTINDAANTNLNGPVTLTAGDQIELWWDSTGSEWTEIGRNN